MTNIADIKSALHQQVANTEDERVLHKMQLYFKSLAKSDKKIVAYSSKWKPLTAKEYKAEIEESIDQHRRGKVISQKKMEQRL
jgi:chromosome segregation and condensation protein ScpB